MSDDVKILASGFGFPEGPVVMPDGSVILTEIRNGRCSRVTADGKSSVFSECGGGPNGLAIGPDGALYLCNNGGARYVEGTSMSRGAHAGYKGGSIQRLDAKTGAAKTLWCSTAKAASTSPISASASPAIATMAASITRYPTARRSRALLTPW
jgi:sugar lactone lactonase YvrE